MIERPWVAGTARLAHTESPSERSQRIQAEQDARRAERQKAILAARTAQAETARLRATNESDMARNGQAQRNRLARQDRQALAEFRQDVRHPEGWRHTESEPIRHRLGDTRTPVRTSRPAGMPHIPVVLVSRTRPPAELEMATCQMCPAVAIVDKGTVHYCPQHQEFGQRAINAECRQTDSLDDLLWAMEIDSLAQAKVKREQSDAKVRAQQPAKTPVPAVPSADLGPIRQGDTVLARDRENYGTVLHAKTRDGMAGFVVHFHNNQLGTDAYPWLPASWLTKAR